MIHFHSRQLPLIYYKDRNENVDNKLHIQSLSAAKKVNIGRLNVDVNLKGNIKQVIDGIDGITSKLNALRNKSVRQKRNIAPSVDTVNVKRLNIPKELFESNFLFDYKFFRVNDSDFFRKEILVKRNGTATYNGQLTTKKLRAKAIKFSGHQDPNVGTILPVEHKKIDGISRIRNLEVKSINGIDWNEFYGSLYLTESPQPIEGIRYWGAILLF